MSAGSAAAPAWKAWLSALETNEGLRARASLRPTSALSLAKKSPTSACEELRIAWKQIYRPSEQHLSVLRQLIDRAIENALQRFGCASGFEDAVYARTPVLLHEPEIWGLTGLAGVGKSALQRALVRALAPPPGFHLAASVQVPTRPIVPLTLTAQRSSQAVLRQLANPLFVGNRTNIGASELTRHLREWLFASGVLMVPVDELQSMTRSENATTLIANLLAELNELGPYVVYCFNYSLGHKLLTRPQEDKDRLLANCLHLEPPSRDDPYWLEVVQEYVRVAPNHFDLAPERDAAELHRMTGGLYRLLGKLLLEACRTAWPTSVIRRVSMADVRRAFQSGAFTSQRADVEALQTINVSAGERKRRKDLVCPFPDLTLMPPGGLESQKYPASRQPTAAAHHAVESALTVVERSTLDALRGSAGQAAAAGRRAATVTKLSRRAPVTAESLMAGAELLSGSRGSVAKANVDAARPAEDPE